MSNLGAKDSYLEIPRGKVPGQVSVNKFGNNPALATSSIETVWDGSTQYGSTPGWPASAAITHIWEQADVVADRGLTIEVQGLDTNWDLVTQTKALDASDSSTAVALDTALRRVFRKKVLGNIVAGNNIRVGDSGKSNYYSQISTGNNQTLMAIYTVPDDKTAYITNYYASLNKDSGGGDPDVVIRLWFQDNENTYKPQLKHVLGLDSGATSYFQHYFGPYYAVTKKTDIYIECENLSASATADVSAGFDLILVDN